MPRTIRYVFCSIIVVRFDTVGRLQFQLLYYSTHGSIGGRGLWRKQTQPCSKRRSSADRDAPHSQQEGEGRTHIEVGYRLHAEVMRPGVPTVNGWFWGNSVLKRTLKHRQFLWSASWDLSLPWLNISVLLTEARLLLAGHTSKKGNVKSYSNRATIMIAGSLKCCIYMELCVCVPDDQACFSNSSCQRPYGPHTQIAF